MSLFTKIFFVISISMGLFFSIAVGYIISEQRDLLIKKLNNKISYNNKLYLKPITQAFYYLDKKMLSTTLDSLYLDEEVVEITLIDINPIGSISLNTKKS